MKIKTYVADCGCKALTLDDRFILLTPTCPNEGWGKAPTSLEEWNNLRRPLYNEELKMYPEGNYGELNADELACLLNDIIGTLDVLIPKINSARELQYQLNSFLKMDLNAPE